MVETEKTSSKKVSRDIMPRNKAKGWRCRESRGEFQSSSWTGSRLNSSRRALNDMLDCCVHRCFGWSTRVGGCVLLKHQGFQSRGLCTLWFVQYEGFLFWKEMTHPVITAKQLWA